MFKFAEKRLVLWPITVQVPRADAAGEFQEFEAKLLYEVLNMDQIDEMARGEYGVTEIGARIHGWEDIVDEHDEPLVFSAETRAAMIRDPYFFRAAVRGLVDASKGASAKNS